MPSFNDFIYIIFRGGSFVFYDFPTKETQRDEEKGGVESAVTFTLQFMKR